MLPNAASVRSADLALAVEHHPERQQSQPRQFGHHGHVVAHPAVRPAHPVHAIADQRVESGRGDGAEPRLRTVGTFDQAEVDCCGDTGRYDVDSGRRIARRKPIFAGMVVAGAAGTIPSGMPVPAND